MSRYDHPHHVRFHQEWDVPTTWPPSVSHARSSPLAGLQELSGFTASMGIARKLSIVPRAKRWSFMVGSGCWTWKGLETIDSEWG